MRRKRKSRSSCEERGLKSQSASDDGNARRRSSCEERGLKYVRSRRRNAQGRSLLMRGAWIEMYKWRIVAKRFLSLLMRGAWIEMVGSISKETGASGRSSCEERGLKCNVIEGNTYTGRRSSCEERGLKFFARTQNALSMTSLLMRGAWIEMTK